MLGLRRSAERVAALDTSVGSFRGSLVLWAGSGNALTADASPSRRHFASGPASEVAHIASSLPNTGARRC